MWLQVSRQTSPLLLRTELSHQRLLHTLLLGKQEQTLLTPDSTPATYQSDGSTQVQLGELSEFIGTLWAWMRDVHIQLSYSGAWSQTHLGWSWLAIWGWVVRRGFFMNLGGKRHNAASVVLDRKLAFLRVDSQKLLPWFPLQKDFLWVEKEARVGATRHPVSSQQLAVLGCDLDGTSLPPFPFSLYRHCWL